MIIDGDVLIYPDGNLFLHGGAHNVFEYVTGARTASGTSIENFAENIASRTAFCAGEGVAYAHVVFPDKQTCLLDEYQGSEVHSLGRSYVGSLGDVFTFSPQSFRTTKTFHLTDTHWNGHGQVEAMIIALSALGMDDVDAEELRRRHYPEITMIGRFSGDLAQKLNPKPTEDRWRYGTPPSTVMLTNKLDAGNDGFIKIAFNPAAPDRRLLIFGDSFAQIAVEPLANYFRTVLFLRTRFFHPEFVAMMRPTHVLTSNVERYLSQVDSDESRPVFFLLPGIRGRTTSPDRDFSGLLNAVLSYGRTPYYKGLMKVSRDLGHEDAARGYRRELNGLVGA